MHLLLGKVDNRGLFRLPVSASGGDSKDGLTDALLEGNGEGLSTGNGEAVEFSYENSSATRFALAEAKARQQEAENERDRLIEELAFSEAKQQEYAASLRHTQELAVSELEAAKSMFNQKLQESLDDKFALESQLILAKQDAVELALQVEKLAEIAFQQATSHILADAQQRVSAAETSAAEAAYHIEEQIRGAAEGAILSIVKQSEDTFNKVISVTEEASQQAKNAITALSDEIRVVDEITSLQSFNWQLENTVRDLESQLLIRQNEIEKLKSELENVQEKASAAEVRASNAERALIDLQETTNRMSSQLEEEMKAALDKVKREAAGREKAIAKAFKLELESIKSAVDAAKMAIQVKDEAYARRCAALERSLRTSEAALNVWRQRAESAESMLQEGGALDRGEEMAFMANGGRIDLLADGDSEKWKLLADGPRREIPDYMARRIRSLLPRFPPRKVHSEVLATDYPVLSLPKADEVWSIVQEKPKQDDLLIKHVAEKEAIEKQRKTLERALRRRTIKRQLPEETKLEPGTGTGREIVVTLFLNSAKLHKRNA
ncbi:hypothetical protein EJ110_NYTH46425 [Nymphaea thermarum]|nr:hypothetical protein EJ110_NYTH46425 [Nymphaea thermarum]